MLSIPTGLSTTTTSRSRNAIALSGRGPVRGFGARSSTTTTAPGETREAESRHRWPFTVTRPSAHRSRARDHAAPVWPRTIAATVRSGGLILRVDCAGRGSLVRVLTKLLERLHLDDRRAVVAADPERAGVLRIVEIDAADVGRARQHVFRVPAALDVEARHAVGQHRPGPRLAVAAGDGVIGCAPRRRHLPLRDALGPGIEHADGVALIFGEPQPALVIDAAAPRAGVRSRGQVDGRVPGLGVDSHDVAGREIEQIGVVLRVRVDAVGPDALAAARILEGAEVLHLVGDEIETVDMAAVGVLDPHLVVAVRALDRDMAELACVRVPFLGGRPHPELLALPVGLRDGALVHHADPGVVVAVEFEIERAFRPSRLDNGDRILRHLAGLRVHLAEEHLAEVGVPDVALAIEKYVVRLDQGIRQDVFRDGHACGFAGEPRLGPERVSPGLLLAQVDAGEPFRRLPAAAAALDVARRLA